MSKPRNNCFIFSFIEALTLKKTFKAYVSEKKSSIKGTVKRNKNKNVDVKKNQRNDKSPRKNSYSNSVLTEDSIHNFIIKSVLGFIGGILLTYTCFMFFVFSLNFTLKRATLICMGLGIILSLGLAFSVKIRCTVFLCIPQLFSKRGRQALLAYAFILALSGPAKNTLHNVEVMSESLACGQEQIKQAENELVNCVQKPNTIAKKSIEKLLEKINPAVKFYKHFILQLYRTCFDILETFFSGQKWLSSIILLCNEKVGNPNERCENLLEESIENCKSTSTSPNWENLCSLYPEEVERICSTESTEICPDIKDFRQISIPKFQKRLDAFKRRAMNVLYVKVEGQQTHLQPNKSNTFHEEYQGMATEIRQKTDQFLQYFDFMSVIFGIFILVLFVKVVIYRHKFLTEDHYDNRFITRDFEDIDNTRTEFNMETVLPLTYRERRKYIKVSSIRLIPCEKIRLLSSFIFLIFATFKIIIHMLTDSCLYWILSSVRRDERLLYMSTLKEEQPTMAVKILGNGMVAALVKNITNAVERQYSTPDLDPTPCLPDPVPPDYNRYYQIIALVLICWLLALFEPYGLRLRHTVMVTYHPDRARERAIWLYNSILRSRTTFVEVARKEMRRKYRYMPEESNFSFHFTLKKSPLKCLLCKEKIVTDDYYKCPTVNCVGIYCSECFELLKFCSICRDGQNLDDFTYTSEEMDSSDEGGRGTKKPCKCSKIEQKLKKFKKNRVDDYYQGRIVMKVRKFYFMDEKNWSKQSKIPHSFFLKKTFKRFKNKSPQSKKKSKNISDQESSDWDFNGETSSSGNEAQNKLQRVRESLKEFEKEPVLGKIGVVNSEQNIAKAKKNVQIKNYNRNDPEVKNVKKDEEIVTKSTEMEKVEVKREIKKFDEADDEKFSKSKDKIKKSDSSVTRLENKSKQPVKVENKEKKLTQQILDTYRKNKIEMGKKKLEVLKNKLKLDKAASIDSRSSKSNKSKWSINTVKDKYLNASTKKNLGSLNKQPSVRLFKKLEDKNFEKVPSQPGATQKESLKESEKSGSREKIPKKMIKLLKKDFEKGLASQLLKRQREDKALHHPSLEMQNQSLPYNPRSDSLGQTHPSQPYNPSHNQFEHKPQIQLHSHFDPLYDPLFKCKIECKLQKKFRSENKNESPRQSQYSSQYRPQSQSQPQSQSKYHLQVGCEPRRETFEKKENLENDPTLSSERKGEVEEKGSGSVRSLVMNVTEAPGYPLPLENMIYMNYPELKAVDEYNAPVRRTGAQQVECVEVPSAEPSECLLGFFKKPPSQCPVPDEDFICIDPQKRFSESTNSHVCTSDCNCCCKRKMNKNLPCGSLTNIYRRNPADSVPGSIDSLFIRRTPGCISIDSEEPSRVASILGLDSCSNIKRSPGYTHIKWKDSPDQRPYVLDCSKFRKSCDPCRECGIQINAPKTEPLNCSKYRRLSDPNQDNLIEQPPSTLDPELSTIKLPVLDGVPRSPDFEKNNHPELKSIPTDNSKYENNFELSRNLDFKEDNRIFEEENLPPESSPCSRDSSNIKSPFRNLEFSSPEPKSSDSFECKNCRSPGSHRNLESAFQPELDSKQESPDFPIVRPRQSRIFTPEERENLPPIHPSDSITSRDRRRSLNQVTFAPEPPKTTGFYSIITDSSDDDYLLVRPTPKFRELSTVSEPEEDALEVENLLAHSFGEQNQKKANILKANLAKTYKKNLLEERDTENEDYRDTSDIDDNENTPDHKVFLSDEEFEKLSQTLLKEKEMKEKSKPQLSWAPDLLSDLPSTSKPKDSKKDSL